MNTIMLTLSNADARLLLALVRRRRPIADVFMRWTTRIGSWYTIVPIALVLALGAVPGLAEAGRLALWTLVSSHVVVQVLKRTLRRERPRMLVGLSFLIEPEDRFSFPSGHAASGLSVALPIALALAGPWGLIVFAFGALIGISRCYLGVHYPGDVVMGWLLAVTAMLAGPLVLPFF